MSETLIYKVSAAGSLNIHESLPVYGRLRVSEAAICFVAVYVEAIVCLVFKPVTKKQQETQGLEDTSRLNVLGLQQFDTYIFTTAHVLNTANGDKYCQTMLVLLEGEQKGSGTEELCDWVALVVIDQTVVMTSCRMVKNEYCCGCGGNTLNDVLRAEPVGCEKEADSLIGDCIKLL
ncbi:hypothetical protein Tco_0039104 [Tanacetum coccineum]